ncbi:MAG: sensor histidine kinase [Lachnospiraceae bacterium]|jgi:two-component system sensor histidine kinase YesM|nr:sensor histidine kinase [Lachnospiraceae bacterium]
MKKRIRTKKHGTILSKLRIIMLVPFFVFFLIIVLVLGVQYREKSYKEIEDQITYEDETISQTLEAKIENAQSSVNTMILQLNEVLGEEDLHGGEGPAVNISMQRKIYKCMINTFTTFSNAEQVIIVWNNGVTWYENWIENYSMQNDGQVLLKELDSLGVGRSGMWLMQLDSYPRTDGAGPYFAKKYVDVDSGSALGYVVLKPSGIFASMDSDNAERTLYLFGPSDELIHSSSAEVMDTYTGLLRTGKAGAYSEELRNKLQESDSGAGRNLGEIFGGIPATRKNTSVIDKYWTLISVTDTSASISDLNRTIYRILLLIIITAFAMYFILNYFMGKLILPIQNLSDHMVNAPDELPSPIAELGEDNEIGILVKHFNQMAERNKALVDLLLEEKKQQEHLKFQLLQSQIKPHFLYNSLDTIYCLAEMGQNEDAAHMTKYLSDYYRHVLSKGMDWVLLTEEIEQTRSYLQIQTIRYRNLLDYEVVVNDNVEDIRIPKLTMQPLVENAIYHGIKPLGKKGSIRLLVSQDGDRIEIRVVDDGVGMSRKQFEEEIGSEHHREDGFGLYNVAERLAFYYGKNCSIEMEDRESGTSILLRIQVPHDET